MRSWPTPPGAKRARAPRVRDRVPHKHYTRLPRGCGRDAGASPMYDVNPQRALRPRTRTPRSQPASCRRGLPSGSMFTGRTCGWSRHGFRSKAPRPERCSSAAAARVRGVAVAARANTSARCANRRMAGSRSQAAFHRVLVWHHHHAAWHGTPRSPRGMVVVGQSYATLERSKPNDEPKVSISCADHFCAAPRAPVAHRWRPP